MNNILRNAILLGMGGYEYAKEGIRKFVKDLEADGDITPEEGKKLVKEVMEKGKEFMQTQSKEFTSALKKVTKDINSKSKTKKKVAKKKPTSVKKTTTKKKSVKK